MAIDILFSAQKPKGFRNNSAALWAERVQPSELHCSELLRSQ
jgi:hypothetical protein